MRAFTGDDTPLVFRSQAWDFGVCNSDTTEGWREGGGGAGRLRAGLGKALGSDQGKTMMWGGISGIKETGVSRLTRPEGDRSRQSSQGAEGWRGIRGAEHDAMRERGFDEGDGS